MILAIGCTPKPQQTTISVAPVPETTEIVAAIEAAFGAVERDNTGNIIAVDLAKGRASATDEVLRLALKLPNLKRFRLAGSSITPETFATIETQKSLEDLFLKDLPIDGEQIIPALLSLPKLQRLTLRCLTKVSVLPKLPGLRNLALIEMNITESMFRSIIEQQSLVALDIRDCSGLTSDRYRSLKSLNQITDLKIGGFAVNDEVLEAITPIPNLTGLTIDDAFITPEGFAKFVAYSPSAATLETLVFNQNMSLLDESLLPLKNLPQLKRLTVCGMMVTGNFLARLSEDESTRPKLKQLSLRKTLLMPEEVEALKKYPELRILNLSGIGLNREIIETVASLDSLEELDIRDCPFDDGIEPLLQKMKTLKKLIR
ncbi:hypothetical protein FACS18942_10810 [Planctomycetales bacterium]|nr:hypothetical protein FACS18942_10810 [Planctomycetales bacterium]